MNKSTFSRAKKYATSIGERLTDISLSEFIEDICNFLYINIDISFKDYFLEIIEDEEEFVIHHSKLLDYGIMISTRSSSVLSKLQALDMVETEDYVMHTICERGKSGAQKRNIYMLTPEAFKMCLIRSRCFPGQGTDPKVYAKYFILLEKIIILYEVYQSTYKEKKKEAENVKLHAELEEMRAENGKLHAEKLELQTKLGEMQAELQKYKNGVFDKSNKDELQYICVMIRDTEDSVLVKVISQKLRGIHQAVEQSKMEGYSVMLEKTVVNDHNFKKTLKEYNLKTLEEMKTRLAAAKFSNLKIRCVETTIPKFCPFSLDTFKVNMFKAIEDTNEI